MRPSDGIPALRRRRLGPLTLAQILLAEAAVLAVIAGVTRGLVPTLLAAAVAALLLPVLFARKQGRWWLEHHQLARHLQRRRAARPDTDAGPLLAALRTIAPGLTVRDVTAPSTGTGNGGSGASGGTANGGSSGSNGSGSGSNGNGGTANGGGARVVGVARDDAGWFSVIALPPDAGPLPLDVLTGLLTGTDQPGVVLQLVTRTVPAPSPDVHPASPAASSYRQLMDSPTPAHRESAIGVRVDARTLAEALLDPAADPATPATLTAGLARKIVTTLRRLGITGRALTADELLASLARHCDVEPGSTMDETWTHWRSAQLAHRTYWLRTWPPQPTDFFTWAATAPVTITTVALVVKADDQGIAIRALLHLATRPDADTAALDSMLLDGARSVGAELHPLDGEQGPALYATAPTGGGAG